MTNLPGFCENLRRTLALLGDTKENGKRPGG